MQTDKTTAEQILEHYITKTAAILVFVFGVIKAIVLPIQEIQLNIAELQKQIVEIKEYNQRISQNEKDIRVLQVNVDNLNKNK